MNRIAVSVAIIGALAAATPALAQTKQQIAWCNGKDGATPQQMFAGCDAGIKSGKYKGAQLAPFILNRGRALSDLGDKNKAMADYNQGLKLSPKDLSGLLNRSNIYSERGELDKAQADLDRAIAINAKFTLAYYNRGTLFHKTKDYKRAVDDFTVVIKNAPKFGPAYNNRSSAYTSLKQYDKAIADSTMSISLLPANATDVDRALLHGTRAVAYGKTWDYVRAISDMNEAVRLNPSRVYLMARQASYDISGQPALAMPDIDELIKRDPKDAGVWATRCLVRTRMGEPEAAMADCNRALELDPRNAEAFANRGYAYARLKQNDKAIAEFDIALEEKGYAEGKPASDDSIAVYLYLRGVIRIRAGDALGGAKDIATAKAGNPDMVEFYARYGI